MEPQQNQDHQGATPQFGFLNQIQLQATTGNNLLMMNGDTNRTIKRMSPFEHDQYEPHNNQHAQFHQENNQQNPFHENYMINQHQPQTNNAHQVTTSPDLDDNNIGDKHQINNLHHQNNQYQQAPEQDQNTLTTNGHDQFYDCNQQQAQFLNQHHQSQYSNNNNNQLDNKLYTDLDEQQQVDAGANPNRVRFLNTATSCEATSSTNNTNHQFNNTNKTMTINNQAYGNSINHHHHNQQQRQLINQINQQQQRHQADTTNAHMCKPYVEIVEQPARCALRFRYKCEGRSAGSLPGASSTIDNKTFPSIRINNYKGRAVVVISTVTLDEPYKAHPHNIVGREGCKKGICTIVIKSNELQSVRSFPSLGIQCVKRRDIEESLGLRESINVDPFRQGFEHKHNSSNIDLNAVRLCFQVFIEGSHPGKCDVPLMPIVSSPIHDKKAMSDLVITRLSHCSAPATGGREVILLCDRITKEDIKIRFYEERNGRVFWEDFYEPTAADIHKQVAICFKTPKYYNENIQAPVMVRIQLKRISDNQVSESRPFQFLPCESDEDIIHRKRQKIDWVNPERYVLR